MPNKQLLDKAAWEWAKHTDPHDITDLHIETAYRVLLTSCKSTCRRNCKGNPHCLSGLGERNWINDIADEEWHEIDDPNSERKSEGSFVGLKNLGATCYVNSFLQVWYHNPNFRQAIYKWKPIDDPQEKSQFSNETAFKPVSCIGHLQLIFALMQFSNRRYIDPTPFITMLGLNTTEQQDAQEFCQLFISLLEEKISYQTDLTVRNIVQHQYSGEYSYITRCHQCLNESQRPSQFYELDLSIKGHKDLFGCLKEFLQEEKLEGSDQYYCSFCQNKQDATRFIRLLSLPPVLHIQLLRFVFDRQTSSKKKLNSFIRFPEVLDASQYLGQEENTTVYEVTAVLIHRGPSAYSGHYVAHICDTNSGSWFKFNDEVVEKIEGKKLKLGTEESLTVNKAVATKAPKQMKGWHSSNNAYMLVYTLKKTDESIPQTSIPVDRLLPEHLQEAVIQDNQIFEDWVKDLAVMREENVSLGKAKQSEIRKIYLQMPVNGVSQYEWINSSWLHKWLTNESGGTVPPVDNNNSLCPHEKLSPDKVDKMKCINKVAADIIFDRYGGGPRLIDAFCRKCVEARCHITRIKARLADDQKKMTTFLRAKISEEDSAFWIGKVSLRRWRLLVLSQNEDLEDSKYYINCGDETNDDDNALNNDNRPDSVNGGNSLDQDEEEDSKMLFNDDVLCIHKNLKVEENGRRLIISDAWNLLKQYFPDAPQFDKTTLPCETCTIHREEMLLCKDKHRTQALNQKSLLSDLYLDRNRPLTSKLVQDEHLYGINQSFIDDWRRFLKDPSRREPIKEINNLELLCQHGGLPYIINNNDVIARSADTSERLTWLTEFEWTIIQNHFKIDLQISLSPSPKTPDTFICTPEFCEGCLLARLADEEQKQLEYVNQRIFVRRISKHESLDGDVAAETSGGEDGVNEQSRIKRLKNTENYQNGDGLSNKEITSTEEGASSECISTSGELLKLSDVTGNVLQQPYCNGGGAGGGGAERRSKRRRKQRGEMDFHVSATDSLKDLKVQIMKHFSVAPYDQHLSLSGRPLVDNQATLASLKVIPGSLIMLKVDEVSDEAIVMEDHLKATNPETGFKGTCLLRR